ncbi:MAG: hypothetical protein ACRC2K_02450 [Clostridium sp.]
MQEEVFKIPIRIDDYEDLFNSFDYRSLEYRELNEEIDGLIDKIILSCYDGNKNLRLELDIYMPLGGRDLERENMAKSGIGNYYRSYLNYHKKINGIGIKRILYYILCSFVLFGGWNYLENANGETFLGALLNAGGTVLLWEIMSLIFIERKNRQDRKRLNRKMLNMNIEFKYI